MNPSSLFPTVSMIWAQTPNGTIGNNGTIPWDFPEDLAFFRRVTRGAAVVMGRKTWESLPAAVRPLPSRRNIVLTSNLRFEAPGAELAPSLHAALALANSEPDCPVYVIGGGQIYEEALTVASTIVITMVDIPVEGDTLAPSVDRSLWRLVSCTEPLVSDSGYRFWREVWSRL